MEFIQTKFKDAYIIKPQVFTDQRGFFLESYSKRDFEKQGITVDFVQDNHSRSTAKGVLRGLHFQKPPFAQTKLVRVTKGSVYDVIVDLRKGSETFGQWEGFRLSADSFKMLLIPKGFAHGFLTLEDDTEFMYKCDEFYHPEANAGIIWNDPDLKINWPIENPTLSEKDGKLQSWKDFLNSNPF
ncbi:MAG: dTDP-4-dehydrorhamnose 3,5-epimerase [Candidatus Moranbacteria bacterium RIFOXYA2_FULL_43_15]|nr:MAG: dTDP-4-dehydrorhamnose 3,5-epimerase [Candidatus Moranbacteria bacterium RIFOXYA2_FULL_43_15]